MSVRTAPPFRADHVGSLLRTAALKEARAQREGGKITGDKLKAVEDREIEQIIRRQEEIGLKAVTDGEFRRAFWNYDFLDALPGVEAYLGDRKIKFQGTNPKPMMLRVIGKLGRFTTHPMLEHFVFLKAHTRVVPKMTIPSPSSLHFRYGRDAVPENIYPDMNDFYRDLGQTYRQAVHAFADAGCRYLQLDEVNFESWRRSGKAAGNLCWHDQRRDCRHPAGYDDHDASVPWQFSVDVRRFRRLRAGGGNAVQCN